MARDVGWWLDEGQALLTGDGRARRVPGLGRRENRIDRLQWDSLGQFLARAQPVHLRHPIGQPPRTVRDQAAVVGHDRFEFPEPALKSTHGAATPSHTVRVLPSIPSKVLAYCANEGKNQKG
jgi:hypothetical protein